MFSKNEKFFDSVSSFFIMLLAASFFALLPFAFLGIPLWLCILLTVLVSFFPQVYALVSPVFWIWALVKTISGPQNGWSVFFYVAFFLYALFVCLHILNDVRSDILFWSQVKQEKERQRIDAETEAQPSPGELENFADTPHEKAALNLFADAYKAASESEDKDEIEKAFDRMEVLLKTDSMASVLSKYKSSKTKPKPKNALKLPLVLVSCLCAFLLVAVLILGCALHTSNAKTEDLRHKYFDVQKQNVELEEENKHLKNYSALLEDMRKGRK